MSVCSICHGGCCRRYYVDFTGYDLVNISNTLDLEIPFFSITVPVKDEDAEELSKDAALFKFPDVNDGNYVRFCLKRIPSSTMPNSTKCLFLQEWNGETLDLQDKTRILGRCGIYSVRPLTCAIFRAKLDTDGLIGYVVDPQDFCETKTNPAYNLCPRALVKEDFTDHSGELSRYLALHKYEMTFFKALAASWNEDSRTYKEFLPYIKKVYANRIQFKPFKKSE